MFQLTQEEWNILKSQIATARQTENKAVQGKMSKENVQELSDEELSLKPLERDQTLGIA